MNSAKTQTKCSSAFQLTFNQVEVFDDVLAYVKTLKPNYMIACRETAPTTEHKHIHLYIQFPRSKRMSIAKLKGAHVEKCFGTPQQNKDYIEKEGDIILEEGEMRKKGALSIKEVEKLTSKERKELPIQLYNIVQKIEEKKAADIIPEEIYKTVHVEWHWGESGAGKTRTVMTECKGKKINMVKYENGFWHGLGEAEIAVYDDWRDSHMKPTELINFIDYYKHPMNIKGGSKLNNYKLIYITSIQNPEVIYQNTPEEYKRQWLRRIKKIIHHTFI